MGESEGRISWRKRDVGLKHSRRDEENLPLKSSHFDASITIFLYFVQNILCTVTMSGGGTNNFTGKHCRCMSSTGTRG